MATHSFFTDFQGETLLSESSHFTFVYDDNECSLVVLNTQADDSGVYTCTAKNLAGSVSCKAELTVHIGKHFHFNEGACISKHVVSLPPFTAASCPNQDKVKQSDKSSTVTDHR